MGTADNTWGGGYGARQFNPGDWANAGWRRQGARWTAFEIVAMVLGFIVFWPIGLAVLAYKFWQSRSGGPDLKTFVTDKVDGARTAMSVPTHPGAAAPPCGAPAVSISRRPATWPSTSGVRRNSTRLDEERRKLDEAQREFGEYVDAIRRAKDREEFERFMAERRAKPAGRPRCLIFPRL